MPEVPEQPTLTDGVVTLRRWRADDVDEAVAGHDDVIAHWFGWPRNGVNAERMKTAIANWHIAYDDGRAEVAFAAEVDGTLVGSVDLRRRDQGVGEMSWILFKGHRGQGYATRAVRMLADYALTDEGQGGLGYWRVEAKVEPGNQDSLRVATRSGLRREGVRRVEPGEGDRDETESYVVLARLRSDPPLSEPESFRSLLNSFLPRKRAIGQLLVRDTEGRVLLCQLTYKRDWDLPGGVVEVGESPRLAVGREIEEELALDHRGRRPGADRLAAAVGRLGRRGVPGLRRRRPRRRDPRRDGHPAPRDPHRRVLHPRPGRRALRRLHRPPRPAALAPSSPAAAYTESGR